MNEFILSDESLNSCGFKVLTDGINLTRFLQNPIMYYNHDRDKGVIGRWENVYIKDKKLYGTPVFDEKDPFAASIAEKVAGGFLKAASIGISNIQPIEENEVITIQRCELHECSICDIPSNENALILYVGDKQISDKKEIIKFSTAGKKDEIDLVKAALGLNRKTTFEDVLHVISMLKHGDNIESVIRKAVALRFILPEESNSLINLSKTNQKEFYKYLETRKRLVLKEREQTGMKLIDKAIADGRIIFQSKNFWLQNYNREPEMTAEALESLPEYVYITDLINAAKNKGHETWTLSDYRKFAPNELKANPDLYYSLVESERIKTKQKSNKIEYGKDSKRNMD